MRHVRDVMRLRSAGMSSREIARLVGAAPSTVRLTIRRFEASDGVGRCPMASPMPCRGLGCLLALVSTPDIANGLSLSRSGQAVTQHSTIAPTDHSGEDQIFPRLFGTG